MATEEQELKFPVEWHYKIICAGGDGGAHDLICGVLQANGFDHVPVNGNSSSGGKYVSYRVSVKFDDLESMRKLSRELEDLPCVKYLI